MGDDWKDSETWTFNPQAGIVITERFRGKLFDSYFGRSSHPTQNHVLKLFLRIDLTQVNNKKTAVDGHKKKFPIKNWDQDKWIDYVSAFERQANLWNNRFWLIPPRSFSLWDVNQGSRRIRPNIQCRLITQIISNNAHRSIKVVNLDIDAIKKQMGNIDISAGTFTSTDKKYDSLDVDPGTSHYVDDKGKAQTISNVHIITHEIGHAIGEEHIGVMKSRPYCTFAISLQDHGIKKVTDFLARGRNSTACYGELDSADIANNVMGFGNRFEEINAQPWVDRIAMHTNTLARDWRVVLSKITPMTAP